MSKHPSAAGPTRRQARVTIVTETVPQYRVPFFNALRDRLAADGVCLSVVYSPPNQRDQLRDDSTTLEWGRSVPRRVIRLGGRELVWQAALPHLRDEQLIVVNQQARQLLNYPLLMEQLWGRHAVAFWGHGRSLRAQRSVLAEWVKLRISRWPAWWFAYNDFSATIVQDIGYPPDRITSVQNAIDTRALTEHRTELDAGKLDDLRTALGLTGQHVGICCATLRPGRRVQYLIDAARAIRSAIDDFELIVVGDGEDAGLVRDASLQDPWIHWVGSCFGANKTALFALADVTVAPGPLGLGVLDTFALEVPLVGSTTADHGPEYHYLIDGENALLVDDGADPRVYAHAVVSLFNDPTTLARLRTGCRHARERYTMEAMVDRFAAGVQLALDKLNA